MNRRQRPQAPVVTKEMRLEYFMEMEKSHPGYLGEREKLCAVVLIFTGVRLLYSLFYFGISIVYGLDLTSAAVNLLSTAVFYFWYTLMLQSGCIVAVLMLAARGIGLAMGGAGLLRTGITLAASLPGPLAVPLIFAMTAGMAMQFLEAVFCIYVLVNSNASLAVKLNRQMAGYFAAKRAPGETVSRMARYKNEEAAEESGESGEEAEKTEGENAGDALNGTKEEGESCHSETDVQKSLFKEDSPEAPSPGADGPEPLEKSPEEEEESGEENKNFT